MNVSLTPQLEQFIAKHVKSGRYQSASEVVREALRLFQDRDWRLAELRKEVQKGIDAAERGEVGPLDIDKFIAEMTREWAQRNKGKRHATRRVG